MQADGAQETSVFAGVGRKPRRDDPVEVELSGFDDRGAAIGRVGNFRVRVARSNGGPPILPGARVAARVLRRRKDRVDAEALEVLAPSVDEVHTRCPHTAECGGCSFQELSATAQLAHKEAGARRALAAYAQALDEVTSGWSKVIPAAQPFHYRNKMDFTFCARRARTRGEADDTPADFSLGLFARGRHDKVLDLSTCALAHVGVGDLLGAARDLAREHNLPAWDPIEHRGFLRHLVVRAPRASGLLVNLVTAADDTPGWLPFVRDLCARVPSITALVQNVTTRRATVAVGEREHVHLGTGVVEEVLLGRRFRISAGSFFQTNTHQAEVLFERLRSWIQARDGAAGGTLFDLYSGGGAIGLVLADLYDDVVGLELVGSAVEDARANARANGIVHARYFEGDVPQMVADRQALGLGEPRMVVLDPPRVGLGPKLPLHLAELGAPFLVLVSCNLNAAARDLEALQRAGYRVEQAGLVDMFPHTPHLEGLFLLARSSP